MVCKKQAPVDACAACVAGYKQQNDVNGLPLILSGNEVTLALQRGACSPEASRYVAVVVESIAVSWAARP